MNSPEPNRLSLPFLLRQLVLVPALWLPFAAAPDALLAQKTLLGRVINGTTNLPAKQQRVELLTLGEGMNSNTETRTAADGSFQFSLRESAGSPHWLLRSIYQGVNYNLSITPSQDLSQPVTLMIYETTNSMEGVDVSLPLMLAQASGNLLYVQEQYLLTNNTQPKRTFVTSKGTFDFDTPEKKLLDELTVSVVGLAGIPLPQEPTPRSEGGYSIGYPMKPGVNEVRVSYKVKFPTNQRDFNHKLFYGSRATKILVLPASLEVSGPGLKASGNDSRTQAAVYQAGSIAKGASLQFKLSGDAPLVSEESGSGDDHDHDEPQFKVVRLPNPVFEQKALILGGFGAFFIIAILLGVRQKSSGAGSRKKQAR